jgi:nucleotide-binding universal stress UspA family protein
MFDKILIAYDGSDGALRAFDAAIDLAHRLNITLYTVTVEEELPGHAELMAEVEDAQQHADLHYSQLAKRARSRAAFHSVSLDCAQVFGRKVRVIVDFAEKGQFDLLVIGASGPSVRGLLFGSTSQRLVSSAPCSVLVIR